MRFSRNLRVSSRSVVCLGVVFLVCALNNAYGSPNRGLPTSTNNSSGNKQGIFDLLKKVINDAELSKPESLKSKSTSTKNPASSKTIKKSESNKTSKKSSFRSELLRQELSKESQENCLSQLLCGNGNVPPGLIPPSNESLSGDYALLIKEFLDIFSDDPDEKLKTPKPQSNKAKENQNEIEDEEDEENDDVDEEDNGRTDEKFVNITGSLVSSSDDEIIGTSSTSTVTSITTGATITELYPSSTFSSTSTANSNDKLNNEEADSHKITMEEIVSESTNPSSARKSRRMEIALSFGNPKKSRYIHRKIREMGFAKTETEKLKIAGKIASKLREPRQCKEFHNVANEILSTCPLTAEVVRYFNSNLKNGSQIAILKQQQVNRNITSNTADGGGLVILNDRGGVPHPYFLDNSPIIANTYIQNDLKNPSVGSRVPSGDIQNPIYENAYPQKFNINMVSLSNSSKKKPAKKRNKKKEEEKKDSDEDEEESDEQQQNIGDDDVDDDEDKEQEEQIDGEHQDEEGDDEEEEDDDQKGRTGAVGIKKNTKRAETTSQKKTVPQKKGVVKVYGVYQPSFDSEFSQTSTQIGSSVVLFDHDDDGDDVRQQRPTIATKPAIKKPVVKPPKSKPNDNDHDASNSEEDEEEDEDQDKDQEHEDDEEVDNAADEEKEQDEEEQETDDEDDKRSNLRQRQRQNAHASGPPVRQRLPPPKQQLRRHYPPVNPSYRRPHNFAVTPSYGGHPAPRPEEFQYQNGKPLRARPPTPYEIPMPMVYKPRPQIRGRLNFVHNPGAALMRPTINTRHHRAQFPPRFRVSY